MGGFWIRRGLVLDKTKVNGWVLDKRRRVGEFWIRGNEVDQSKAENSCQIISQLEWGENYLPVG